jgi:hypothetical protein
MRQTYEGGDAAIGAEPIRDSLGGFFCRKNGIDDLAGYGFWDTDARMTNRDLDLRTYFHP